MSASSVSRIVGGNGGTVSLGDDVSLTIPPGAVTTDTNFSIIRFSDAVPSGYVGLSPQYAFITLGGNGSNFQKPLQVSFRKGQGTTDAVIYWSKPNSATTFEALPTQQSSSRVVAWVTHFSYGFVARPIIDGGAGTDGGGGGADAGVPDGSR